MMSELTNQFIEISNRFNMKQNKKLKLLALIRLMSVIDEIDSGEIHQLLKSLHSKLNVLDIKCRKDMADYKKNYRELLIVVKKKHPRVAKTVWGRRGVAVAMSTTLGASHRSVSSGAIGAGVAYAASLKFDDGTEKKNKE